MKRVVVVGAVALALAGCKAPYAYKGPADAPTAVLKLGVDKIPYVTISETNECPKAPMDQTQPFTVIPAGRTLWVEPGFSSAGLPGGFTCVAPMSFVPQAGKEYFVVYQLSGMRCRGEILSKDASGAVVPVPTKREKFELCMW
ncbi:hypothetical protein [Pseudoduganella chitinolytica]|uniref:Lipoprotein n=1 Tax=Pseudoduganella chitinolytica TaxID=34070 RepID=A0ABY8BIL5_9BURK|nr:hypothetical protein [Pseudoduganella chitinolytica]WEF35821.1 hypothetical protein PX653_14060 [Pseudoduganella chitinolytica]